MEADMEALMAALAGGGGAPQMAPPPAEAESPQPKGSGNLLVDAINAVHGLMVEEQDPKQVSLLGAILNQLTTFQANKAAPPKASGG